MISSQYIDGTLFWKRAYEKLEADNEKLRDRIVDWERVVERTMDVEHDQRLSSPGPVKRKAEIMNPNRANIQTKRRKPIIQEKSIDQNIEPVVHDIDPNTSGICGPI